MAQWLFIPTRIVHIVAGVAWVGSALLFAAFVVPTAAARGPTSGVRFLKRLLDRAWFALYFTAAEALSVLSGAVLYWNISGGFRVAWITSTPGLTFTVGTGAALARLSSADGSASCSASSTGSTQPSRPTIRSRTDASENCTGRCPTNTV